MADQQRVTRMGPARQFAPLPPADEQPEGVLLESTPEPRLDSPVAALLWIVALVALFCSPAVVFAVWSWALS